MALLTWDKQGERMYETGIANAVLYPYASTAVQMDKNASPSQIFMSNYPVGVAWNGLTSVSETPSGAESNPIYADNIKYIDIRSAEEFGATIEAYTYPDEWAKCDGSASIKSNPSTGTAADVPGVNIGQQTRSTFGLCYETVVGNDVKYNDYNSKLHLIYGATASPSERQYQTINDKPEPITFSWELSTTPITNGYGKPTSIITIDKSKLFADKPDDPAQSTWYSKYLILINCLRGTGSGTSGTDPFLPTPDQVAAIFGEQSPFAG